MKSKGLVLASILLTSCSSPAEPTPSFRSYGGGSSSTRSIEDRVLKLELAQDRVEERCNEFEVKIEKMGPEEGGIPAEGYIGGGGGLVALLVILWRAGVLREAIKPTRRKKSEDSE